MLLEKGCIRRDQYDRALVQSARYGETPGYHLVKSGAIEDEELVDFFLRHFSLRYWPRHRLKSIPEEALYLVSPTLAKNLRILPISMNSQNLTLGLTDPSLTHVAEEVVFHTKRFVNPVLISETDMSWALAHYYGIFSHAPGDPAAASAAKPSATLQRETFNLLESSEQDARTPRSVAENKPSIVQVTDDGWGVDDWNDEQDDAPIPLTRVAQKRQTTPLRERAYNTGSRNTLPPPSMKASLPANGRPAQRALRSAVNAPPETAAPAQPESSEGESPTDEREDIAAKATEASAASSALVAAGAEEADEEEVLDSILPFDSAPPPPGDTTPKKNISEILGEIKASDNRDDIVDLALDFLLLFARRVAFLVIRKGEIRGFTIKGEGTNAAAIKSYWVPFSAKSTFRQVAIDGQIHLGPLGRSSSDGVFTAAMGGRPPRVLVVPVDINNRTVGLLYADKLRIEMPPWNLLERLADVVSTNLTRLILTRSNT
jgi:hypothetical protein